MKIKLPFRIISKFHYETFIADHYYMERYRELWLEANHQLTKLGHKGVYKIEEVK